VLSRCLQFNLRPMAPETVLEHLTSVLAQESVPAEPQALRLLARAARGSMRDALSLTDQAIAFGSGQLQEAGVRQMLGSVDRGHVFRLIDALARGDGKTVVETADALRLHGLSAASTLEEMSAVLQRMAVLQAVPQMAVDASDPEAAEIARLAAAMPADETQLLYSICLHGRTELGLAPDEYAALTMALLRLLAFKPAASAEKKTLTPPEPAAPPRGAPQPAAPQPAAPAAAPVPAAPPQALSPEDVNQAVSEALHDAAPDTARRAEPVRLPVRAPEDLRRNQPPALASQAQAAPETVAIPVRSAPEPGVRLQPQGVPAGVPASARLVPTEEGDVWHATVQQLIAQEAITWLLRVERESLNQPTARERLRAALEAAGHARQIAVEVGKVIDSPALRNAHAAAERQRAAEEIVHGDPYVQRLMRDFGAKIVPGSIKPA
jgi:DNA polymerase-3 subunit gamma/tau